MKPKDREFLEALIKTAAPSGMCERVQKLACDYVRDSADELSSDLHGNLIALRQPKGKLRVMLAAHADQIGFMIRYIDAHGYAFLEYVGGPDEKVVPGAHVHILGKRGVVPGVIGKKATHLETKKEGSNAAMRTEMWIDAGAGSREDAERLFSVGDYAVFAPNIVDLANGKIAAPALDDRAGLYVAAKVFRECALQKDVALFLVSTVQEELGGRGAITSAHKIDPHITIAIDVTNASDDPAVQKKKQVDCKLGKGPSISSGPNTNPALRDQVVGAARKNNILYQLAPTAELEGNDAKELQVANGAAAALSIGLPNRNMHTTAEVCSVADLEAAVALLKAFLRDLNADTDLRPFKI
jgi:putative aminopeptidase FrvX